MFLTQRKRYMPMPDYELADEEVAVTIPGRIFDPKYTQLLIRRSDISLADIIQLDRLQKGIWLDKATVSDLRRNGLVEGRYPNVFSTSEVAAAGGKTAEYVDARGFDEDFYMHRILQFLCVKETETRQEIDKLLRKHLSTTLSDSQKRIKKCRKENPKCRRRCPSKP